MANRRLVSYSVAVMVANALTMFFMVLLGSSPQTAAWLSTPLILSITVYKLLIALQVSRIGRELSTGEIQLYLAHTVTRTEYLLSALLVAGITPALLLISTYTITIAIVAPATLLSGVTRAYILYLFLDLLFFSVFTTSIASRGREGAASAIGLITAVAIWLATGILLSIYVYTGYSFAGRPILYAIYIALCISAVMSPFTYYTFYTVYPVQASPYTPPAPIPPPQPPTIALSSILIAVALLAAMVRRFRTMDI